jgi:hypothetical protein
MGNLRRCALLVSGILATAGSLVLFYFLRAPSEIENQFLFGYSSMRLFSALVFVLFLTANWGLVFWLGFKPTEWQINMEHRLQIWFKEHITFSIFTFCSSALVSGALLLGLIPPVIRSIGFLEPIAMRIEGIIFWFFLASLLLNIFFRSIYPEVLRENHIIVKFDYFLRLAIIFLAVFFLYEHILIWTGAANQSRYSYWNLLANEFLQGNLYLKNPPQNHDLTFYNGHWYVPAPPLPAILMMPLAYLIGGENINTSDLSIIFSAINAVLIFLILEQLARHKWIKLSRTDILLLVALFAFGNPHLWVGIRGRFWFVSQILTVTFLALAVLAALRSWSPWWVGIFLGGAILARPNGILTWPFVFAIMLQIFKETHNMLNLKHIVIWSIKSMLPMGMAVALLLVYNHARFENFLDFGYTTINGDPIIVANAQNYGLFSPHFIPYNIKAMFFYLPWIQPGSRWPILPSSTGMSIFLVTPPLLYLFHHYERKWWLLGAWATVILNFTLLIFYHNTGAHQFGYRYILDAIVPLLALLAVALDKKIPWHFILLLLVSIVINLYGTYWFING